ncbi:MAG: AzlD domain-containing protein [Cohaesibacteraceae bacterium]|nr:AzlD domain-containing protein [Cohaesibacteraceae bacterium]
MQTLVSGIDEMTLVWVLAGMAIITWLTRIGGIWMMAFVPITKRVEHVLTALSGSVLVALVVPGVLAGDPALQLGTAFALGIMILTRQAITGMLLGFCITALTRHLISSNFFGLV